MLAEVHRRKSLLHWRLKTAVLRAARAIVLWKYGVLPFPSLLRFRLQCILRAVRPDVLRNPGL